MIAEIIEYLNKESEKARLINENRLYILKKILRKIDKELLSINKDGYGTSKKINKWNTNVGGFKIFYSYSFQRPGDFLNTDFQIYDEYDLEALQKLYRILPKGFLNQPSAMMLIEMPLEKINQVSKYVVNIAREANGRYGEGVIFPEMPKKIHADIEETFESV